jgi:tRNA threonylcarbamoyladenosine biosynthesis protein TsaB
MALLLNIDTATEYASVCLSEEDKIVSILESRDQKNHAAFLQPAIEKICQTTGIKLKDLDAVSVTSGPGSYTGLRVGLSSAKGLCYALNKPLLLVNTLEVMAQAAIVAYQASNKDNLLFCPMIDARRMEVFTAIYDIHFQAIISPCAHILTENSFKEELSGRTIIFNGSGSFKMKGLACHINGIFIDTIHNASNLADRALKAFQKKQFSNLAYSEPAYLKEFYTAPIISN